MLGSIIDYVSPNRFGTVCYPVVILHFQCGLLLTAITANLKSSEMEMFSCAINTNITAYKAYVEKTCFAMYEDAFNSPVRFYAFVLLSFVSVVAVTILYSLVVNSRVDVEAERKLSGSGERQTGAKKSINYERRKKTFCVFYFYCIHLVVRSLLGITFTILQQTVLYPNGFDSQFTCVYPALTTLNPAGRTSANSASATLLSVTCINTIATDKQFWWKLTLPYNGVFAIIAMAEVIYLMTHRLLHLNPRSGPMWLHDSEFIVVYFLRKSYTSSFKSPVRNNSEFTGVNNSNDLYRQKVLKASLTPDINYGPNTSLDEMFVNVAIQTGQTPHKFSKNMNRHEINNVYKKFPKHSIPLKVIKDLFLPKEDTKYKAPRLILALGRPGIGKTVLTRKIMRDWAIGIKDKFYGDKIMFFFKCRWFSVDELRNVDLKTFLRCGTELNEDDFENIFNEITKNPEKVIVIFDGLDEIGTNLNEFVHCMNCSKLYADDSSTPMSALFLFIKIVLGDCLEESTVLVTSRPTANDIYSKLDFDRKAEIIGFTSDKIEEYVVKFCKNNGKPEIEKKMWSHITSSTQLKSLCYIPVNCFIVCVSLLECLIDPANDSASFPTTLTELYRLAMAYFVKHHNRNKECHGKIIKDLQRLAFYGIVNDQLVFGEEFVNKEMKNVGLLNSLPQPIFAIQDKFCFIHLTVQEFLAAGHIVETTEPSCIKELVSLVRDHRKWHLVLQFLAGLLGKKMKMCKLYNCCSLAFAAHLNVSNFDEADENAVYYIYDNQILLMKCLREIDDEDSAKVAATTSSIKHVTTASFEATLSSGDFAAVAFVCKYLNFLNVLNFETMKISHCEQEVGRFLQTRCIKTLIMSVCGLTNSGLRCILGAVKKLKCHVEHEHYQLTMLCLENNTITDAGVFYISEFIKSGHGSGLAELNLKGNAITSSGISKLCEAFSNEYCNHLTVLNLGGNAIGNEGMRVLCRALQERKCKLTVLDLTICMLTDECMPYLCVALGDKRCSLTSLDVSWNAFTDTHLELLSDTVKMSHCSIKHLKITSTTITEDGERLLHDALESKLWYSRDMESCV